MAEIQTISSSNKKGGKRIVKKSTRVDLTPMVDLGFLLITFFVFTSELLKPKVMDIVSPVDKGMLTDICESCVLTVILEKDDGIFYYEGMPGKLQALNHTSFTVDGLRRILLQKKELVKKIRGNADDMVLIIKPSDRCVYKNFVDILDEVNINAIRHYYIDELSAADKKLLSMTADIHSH
jgi:biopolymer transport protein ExbD